MTAAPAIRLVLAACCLWAAVAAGPVAAAPQPGSREHRAMLAQMEKDVRGITVRMGQIAHHLDELNEADLSLSALVAELKNRPPGMMRDAQLQGALKDLRSTLAAKRALTQRQRILRTTLGTRRVGLARAARREAVLLMGEGELMVHHGDDIAAWSRFAEAFDYLTMGNTPPANPTGPTMLPAHPTTLPISEEVTLKGTETPDELREIAQILRDEGEKAKWRALALQRDLARLLDERKTVVTIRARIPLPGAGDEALANIDRHINDLNRHITHLHSRFAAQVGRAGVLEERARQEEIALLAGTPAK